MPTPQAAPRAEGVDEAPVVAVLGIRHHGPGSARSVLEALAELQPDLVLVEGPPELDDLVRWVGEPGLVPPVAALLHAVDDPARASFYPMAVFSPEWVALRWAADHGVPARFLDLPAVHSLAADAAPPAASSDAALPDDALPDTAPADDGPIDDLPDDPVGTLARTAGYDDPERWWEDAVEHRSGSAVARFDAIREAMGAAREAGPPVRAEDARREAAMRRVLRAALKDGARRVAVVCGAYHAPVLPPASWGPVARDRELLVGLPRTKVAVTWVPWTAQRLARSSGYGAGVTSPGWYQHLFVEGSRPGATSSDVTTSWLVRVARTLRAEGIDAAPASVVDAVRTAHTLAAVRGRPSVGLTELQDVARAVLCQGSDLPLQLVDRALVVGEELGRVPDEVPVVPLAADLARRQRTLRLTPTAGGTTVTLDLRRPGGRDRSLLLHRLTLLDVPWGRQVDPAARSTGTFAEAWELRWAPELAVHVVEAARFGTTVPAAAAAAVRERARAAPDLTALAQLLDDCLRADLPDALTDVLTALEERTAHQHDPVALLGTVHPLARASRYGDVRGVDVAALDAVLDVVVARVAVGLRPACSRLDAEAGAAVRAAVVDADAGVRLVGRAALLTPWTRALREVAADPAAHAGTSGQVHRLLLDHGDLDVAAVAAALSRRLSRAAPAGETADWLDGVLSGDALLLVHDRHLLGLVDDWLGGVDESTFDDLLPLLRRTFARFSAVDRRRLGRRLAGGATRGADPGGGVDTVRGRGAARTAARLLGLAVVEEVSA